MASTLASGYMAMGARVKFCTYWKDLPEKLQSYPESCLHHVLPPPLERGLGL